MKKSAFQFSTPCLKRLEYYESPTYVNKNKKPIEMDVAFRININKIEDKNEAIVELIVEIGEEEENCPFFISATEGARFKWDEEEICQEKEVEKLLNQNAPSLLLGYLRPIVALVTSSSKYTSYNIPFINFVKKNEAEEERDTE